MFDQHHRNGKYKQHELSLQSQEKETHEAGRSPAERVDLVELQLYGNHLLICHNEVRFFGGRVIAWPGFVTRRCSIGSLKSVVVCFAHYECCVMFHLHLFIIFSIP